MPDKTLTDATPHFEFMPGADTADDLEARARLILPKGVVEYVADGSSEQRTLAANRAGFGRYRLLPQVLVDPADRSQVPQADSRNHPLVDTSVEVLGTRLAAPVFTCPMGGLSVVRAYGERDLARSAATAGVAFVLNAGSSVSLEEIASIAGPARWQQLSWQGNRSVMADLVQRVQSSGFRAVVLTADNPIGATRRRGIRSGFRVQVSQNSAILARYASPEWQARLAAEEQSRVGASPRAGTAFSLRDLEWLKSVTEIPLVLKGIMSAPDALAAMAAGVDGIIVSNHGGRSLDGLPGSIEVLEGILHAVNGRIPVLIDGGVRSATDIATALALGAAAVGIGRPLLWALACGGEEVITAYLEDVVEELGRTLRMLGVTRVPLLNRSHVSRMDEFLPDSALLRYPSPE